MFLKIKAFFMSLIMCFLSLFGAKCVNTYRVEKPVGFSEYTKKEVAIVDDAQIYVSPDGDDSFDGSFDKPFATIEKARDTVRKMDKSSLEGITVAIKAGDYRVTSLEFTSEDSGTENCPVKYCAYGDGEVVLNGGISISGDKFKSVTDEKMLSRMGSDAKKNVRCIDLANFGITAEQYGKIYTIGTYHTAAQYDGDYMGSLYCELFVNDKRQTIARYPNDGWLKTEEVVKTGLGYESDGSLTVVEGWSDIRNPESDVYRVNEALAKRISTWQEPENV